MPSILCKQEVLQSVTLYCKFEVINTNWSIKLLNVGKFGDIFEGFVVTISAALQICSLFCTLQSLGVWSKLKLITPSRSEVRLIFFSRILRTVSPGQGINKKNTNLHQRLKIKFGWSEFNTICSLLHSRMVYTIMEEK